MSYVYLIFQLISVLATTIFMQPMLRLLERSFPPAMQDELSQPKYIYDQASGEPETALNLVDMEQIRIAKLLPDFLDTVRKSEAAPMIDYEILENGCQALLKRIELFLLDLMNQVSARDSLEKGIQIQNRNAILISLTESLTEWVRTNKPFLNTVEMIPLINSLSESLHFLLISLEEAMETNDPGDVELLLLITGDRGEMMEQIRKETLMKEESFSYENQRALYAITSLFERTVWLIRRIALLLPKKIVATA